MENELMNFNNDYEYIKKEFMPFIDEQQRDSFFDDFLKLAVY